MSQAEGSWKYKTMKAHPLDPQNAVQYAFPVMMIMNRTGADRDLALALQPYVAL